MVPLGPAIEAVVVDDAIARVQQVASPSSNKAIGPTVTEEATAPTTALFTAIDTDHAQVRSSSSSSPPPLSSHLLDPRATCRCPARPTSIVSLASKEASPHVALICTD